MGEILNQAAKKGRVKKKKPCRGPVRKNAKGETLFKCPVKRGDVKKKKRRGHCSGGWRLGTGPWGKALMGKT